MLNQTHRTRLLTLARETIADSLAGRRQELRPEEFDPELLRPAGVFVTLTLNDELRGCIGSIRPSAPLFVAVATSALSAAFRDPRFDPLRPDEFDRVHLEISVMGPVERVVDLGDIVVGRDGLIASRDGRSGLLLPQVATEYGWDLNTFLTQTCRKAGLPATAWRDPATQLEKFSAEVFDEQ